MRKTASLPLSAISDGRLVGNDLRVLAALCAFHGAKAGPISPKRQAIAALTGLRETHVSRATSRLVGFGWLTTESSGGGRARSNAYLIEWDLDPVNGTTGGTVSDPLNGTTGGTVCSPLNGTTHGTVSRENGTTEGTVYGENGTTGGTVSREKGTTGGTVSEHLYEGSSRYNSKDSDKNTDPDLRSGDVNFSQDRRQEGSSFVFGDAVEVLTAHGVPHQYITRTDDRLLIVSWLEAGITPAQLTAACVRASECKRDRRPFGPRYVDQVLKSMQQENNKNATGSGTRSGGFSKGDAIGDEWLQQAQAGERQP